MKIIRLFTLLLCAALAACSTLPGSQDYFVGYTGQGVEITGLKGDLSGAGYDLKSKKAYLLYQDGSRSSLKITGAGIGNNQLALYLEGGGKVVVDLKTGSIASGSVPKP